MTKRERKAQQKRNRGARQLVSWCKRISQHSRREAERAEIMLRVDLVLQEICVEQAEVKS